MVKVVAEIGCNHRGELETAASMVKAAAQCGVDVVKFQKRDVVSLHAKEKWNYLHPCPCNSYGETYYNHRKALELNIEEHRVLKEMCEYNSVMYSVSVWDVLSYREVQTLSPLMIKIPSAVNTDMDLIREVMSTFYGKIHISTGMSTLSEIQNVMDIAEEVGRDDVVLYSCTSGYPVEFKDICLREVSRLKHKYPGNEVGFSGHHLGIAVDNAAVALGASWVERHFTLDRTWKGTDHAASLEPQGLSKLVRDLHATEAALNFKHSEILPVEQEQRDKLKVL
jgi:sialic acid synthase